MKTAMEIVVKNKKLKLSPCTYPWRLSSLEVTIDCTKELQSYVNRCNESYKQLYEHGVARMSDDGVLKQMQDLLKVYEDECAEKESNYKSNLHQLKYWFKDLVRKYDSYLEVKKKIIELKQKIKSNNSDKD